MRDDFYFSTGLLPAVGCEGGVERLHGGEAVGDEFHGGVVEVFDLGHVPENVEGWSPVRKDALESGFGKNGGHLVELLGQHFVEENPADLIMIMGKIGEVHFEFVEGATQTASHEVENAGLQQIGNTGVGETHDGADAGVSGAFGDDDLFVR